MISDLMFQSRVREHTAALGFELTVAGVPEALDRALDGRPALVVLDLHVEGVDWRRAVEAARKRGVAVLAFGRHTEARLLRAARDAGCDRVVARSTLVEELPDLLRALAGGAPRPRR